MEDNRFSQRQPGRQVQAGLQGPTAQPGQAGQVEQPGQAGQASQTGQPNQPSQPGKARQPNQARQPGRQGKPEQKGNKGDGRGRIVPKKVRRRVPEVVMGVALVLLGVIMVVIFTGSDSATTQILTFSKNVQAGQELSGEDLAVVEVPVGTEMTALLSEQAGQVVGARLESDFPAGTVLVPQMVSVKPEISDGMVVAGAVLGAGQYPTSGFSGGDTVNVLGQIAPQQYALVARGVEVYEVTSLSGEVGGSLFVSFLVTDELQAQFAAALADGNIRLSLVSPTSLVSPPDEEGGSET